ncbi:MAG: NUDIX domain-containing protein [Clostridiales bacterium]|nr:NUDIX domain-containing protein [Clostridiales bacterium]
MKNMTESSVKEMLSQYQAHFSNEDLSMVHSFVQNHPFDHWFNRKNPQGHMVASGLVLNGSQLLLIEHPFLQKWIQPGGHVEKTDTGFVEAALREVKEETDYDVLTHSWHKLHPYPFDISIHSIPANADKGEEAHTHFDFRFLFTLAPGTWNNYHQGALPLQWNCLCNFGGTDLALPVAKILFHEGILTR